MISFLAAAAAASSSLMTQGDLQVEDGWHGSVVFNLAQATGNTENTVLGGNFALSLKTGRFVNALEAGGNYTETTTQDAAGLEISDVTQNNWFLQYQTDFELSDRTFLYGRARYDEDQFSGFDRKAFIGAGVGHDIVRNQKVELSVLVGPGVQYFELERPNPEPDDFERSITSAAVFLGQNFKYIIRENVTFEQGLDATIADENTTLANVMSLKTNLTEKLSSRISYSVKHETDPPEGREQTDTLLSVSIGYDF